MGQCFNRIDSCVFSWSLFFFWTHWSAIYPLESSIQLTPLHLPHRTNLVVCPLTQRVLRWSILTRPIFMTHFMWPTFDGPNPTVDYQPLFFHASPAENHTISSTFDWKPKPNEYNFPTCLYLPDRWFSVQRVANCWTFQLHLFDPWLDAMGHPAP